MPLKNGYKTVCSGRCVVLLTVLFLSLYPSALFAQSAKGTTPSEPVSLEVLGTVLDSHGRGVANAALEVFLNGQSLEDPAGAGSVREGGKILTKEDGTYHASFLLGEELLDPENVLEITAHKPSFADNSYILEQHELTTAGKNVIAMAEIRMKRDAGPAFWLATIVFVLAYILISFELLHRTVAAMLGASIMLVVSYTLGTLNPKYHILSYERAIEAIDMNVIFLLMGMMIIVGILKHTGIFQWCAYKCYQLARGKILLLAIILMSFTAVASAFLDNVTTMLLLTPVTIEIAVSLRIAPAALLIPEILASNIGGTATLIGDPPNIMIGSYAGLSFVEFVVNLAPVCVVALVFLFVYTKIVFAKDYKKANIDDIKGFTESLRAEYRITDRTLLGFGLLVMAIVVAFFLTHSVWHMEVSVAALFGASLLFTFGLVTNRINLLELIEKDIEWTTLLFFMFLFILVAGVEETGLLDIVADWVRSLAGGNLVMSICLILWVSAIMSAFVDNIPFTATMLPIVAYLTQVIPGAENGVLWWALAFGACFGGNGTMIGASANVVTLGIAESAGFPVRFFAFMKVAFLYMIISVAIANVWLLMFY
ncbi:ArsB/NhaD family transporter [Desulforhopalus singaporensis]|uniref:Possible tyrosine transporter P-protein n=1 Tax=Desulforhopalus singaporensis TaxID=91360 RepID=A0A1H0L8J6_9BACT|nr:ArsB/NhaD family transporter [Desulforhopalus singaporensis]SDO64537.1 possible tyrosine transporter P-protein [Desulforhopalus singaporensis]